MRRWKCDGRFVLDKRSFENCRDRLQPLHCRRWARNSERLLRVVLRRSGWRWASYFNDSERARIEPYYVQNC